VAATATSAFAPASDADALMPLPLTPLPLTPTSPLTQVPLAPTTEAGHGMLRVTRSGARSVVTRAYATSPLRLLTPDNHGHAAWIYTSSFGGGLVDGDRVAMDVTIEAGATAFLSTQASTKVYRSPRGTSVDLHARVAADGLLVLAPDPVVCFAASRYRQTQRVDLARAAALVAIDWMTSGRRASGERWRFDEYAAQLSVRLDDALLVHDALALRRDDGDLAARMGRFEVLAIVVLIGDRLRAASAEIVSGVGGLPVTRRADHLLSATAVGDAGCVIRIAGTSVEQVSRTWRELLGFVPALLGDDPWHRKW
jgi:urease accessory protein